MPNYTFHNADEAIAVYGDPLLASRKTRVQVREVSGEQEIFPQGNDRLLAVSGVDYVVLPDAGGNPYPCKIDIFHRSWEEVTPGSGFYRRKALAKVIPVPEGDTVIVETLEGNVSVSHPDYIAIGVDGEVYKNESAWVCENLEFLL